MIGTLLGKLFDLPGAFAHPLTLPIVLAVVVLLVVSGFALLIIFKTSKLDAANRDELKKRYWSWVILAPLFVLPVLIGPGTFILAVGILSILCYAEFARATGFFRHHRLSAMVVLGILALTFASLDHWYGLFVAISPLVIVFMVIVALTSDEPKGYIQRVALGVLSFVLFGVGLGHLGYIANIVDYRPVVLVILVMVSMNDVFAYCCGKLFGRRKLAPKTSPGKTVGGALGALILTTSLFALFGINLFANTSLCTWYHLIAMGLIVSLGGQFGDLVISSVKRDLGIKDMGVVIPGHGGLLDRFDSLLLVPPALFHYIYYFLDDAVRIEQTRVFTG